MAHFKFKAVSADGKVTHGVLQKDTVGELALALAKDGLTPLNIDQIDEKDAANASSGGLISGFASVSTKTKDKITDFTRELAIMLSSSVPLDRSLSVLGNMEATDARISGIIKNISEDVRKGNSLADAFEKHKEFSGFYISMVRAGEASGALDITLTRLAEYLERSKALRQTVISALMYPAILLFVAVLSLVLLLGFVVPKFADLFDDMGGTLPLPTQIVMTAGNWVGSYWWLLLAGLAGLVWLAQTLWKKPDFKAWLDRKLLSLAIVGDMIAKIETARLTRTFSTLLQGGVAIVNALSIAHATVANTTLRSDLSSGIASLKEGGALSTTLLEKGNFPALAMHMIQVGEETGQLEEMLVKVADIYEEEVNSAVKRFLALLEPVLILGLGALIAGIILSILVGIMEVNELVF